MSTPDIMPPVDTREFNRIVSPLLRLLQMQHDQPESTTVFMQDTPDTSNSVQQALQAARSPFAHRDRDTAESIMQSVVPADARLYRKIRGIFPDQDDSEFNELVRRGNFARLQAFAGRTALSLTETRKLTLPGTFGIQALMSILADQSRPRHIAHNEDRTFYMLTQFANRLALLLPFDVLQNSPDPFDFLRAINKRTTLLGEAIGGGTTWLNSNFAVLADRLSLRKRMIDLVDAEPGLETEDVARLRGANDELFDQLQRLKRFSIKSAAHTEGNVTWSIHDISGVHEQLAASSRTIQPQNWEPRMVLTAVETTHEDTVGQLVTHRIHTSGYYRPTYEGFGRIVWMDDRGELYADMDGGISLQKLYETAGKPANYESLRQFLLQKYFDLTVPIEIVRTVESETRQLIRADNPDQDRQRGIVYRDLLLPRIRVLRNFETAARLDELVAVEDEEAQAAHPAPRKRRWHDVEAHPRRLPPGYKASPDALALAAKHGVVLGPNETYERKHKKGDPALGEVVHRAKPRQDK